MGVQNPTESEVWTQIKKVVSLLEWWEDACITDGTNGSTLLNAFQDNFETNFPAEVQTAVKNLRNTMKAIEPQANILFQVYIKELARAMNITETDENEMIEQIATYMHNNAQSINSRAFTRASFAAAAGNTGDMTVVRHNTDYLGYPIETGRKAHAISAEVVNAFSMGASYGNDLIQIKSSTKAPFDNLDVTSLGENTITNLNSLYGRDGGANQIKNGAFKTYNSSTGEFNSWNHTTPANVSQETASANCFRANQGTIKTSAQSGTFSSAKFSGNENISQVIKMNDTRTPYLGILRYKYANAADTADIIMRTGNNSTTVAAAADGNWHTLTLVSYYSDAIITPLTFEIEIANYNLDVIYIDDVHFVKMPAIENSYLSFISGATEAQGRREKAGIDPFEGDKWTATDTATDVATIQKRIVAAYKKFSVSLPSNNAGAETIPDP